MTSRRASVLDLFYGGEKITATDAAARLKTTPKKASRMLSNAYAAGNLDRVDAPSRHGKRYTYFLPGGRGDKFDDRALARCMGIMQL